jgi:hypothetical protein
MLTNPRIGLGLSFYRTLLVADVLVAAWLLAYFLVLVRTSPRRPHPHPLPACIHVPCCQRGSRMLRHLRCARMYATDTQRPM